ncbi:cytochrome P450 monooxygenase [Podospora didyma]|uniref:Cytochrome P450 monooxygenase n=1 Tax=Podospora didyma TaxID=330526 RepID=A0AAE0NGD0_9PEZI|nr:cytochrome P450 monooxygenase [Podospora didyma]
MALLDPTVLGLAPGFFWSIFVVGLGIIYLIYTVVYELFMSPLSVYPGPPLWAITSIPYNIAFLSGHMPTIVTKIHERYGDVVRLAPNRLSYTDPEAWQAIRGHLKAGQVEHDKERSSFYFWSRNNLLGAPRDAHARIRRSLAHGFSAKSLQAQEPLIMQYVDLFIERLCGIAYANGSGASKAPAGIANMVAWYNFATFDIIGDLSFGSPFGCLQESRYHPWVTTIMDSVGQFPQLLILKRHFPSLLDFLFKYKLIGGGQRGQLNLAAEKVDQRLALNTERPDFIDAMTKHADDGREDKVRPLTREEIIENARIVVLAGSETTATTLSGVTYYLAKLPEIQRKVAKEVRSAFKSESEININGVQNLTYMIAVLNEAIRMFPPVPTTLPRICKPGGDIICGWRVPEGTALDIFPHAMNYCSRNFADPYEFIPERWMDETDAEVFGTKLDRSRQHALQPFSVGPRNCIGKNLAYVEMRVILARFIWNFDFELADRADVYWAVNCRHYNLTVKGKLNVRLTPAQRV